ncbi:ATP-binding cassette domain-containing protein [Cytobacillus sp. FSL R5-0569]|uniref:ATP-binding cassette domain-containing protein n=1 Tax=Cytobacillus sp. FSL R5-0569 TaxID=2921649 RepID=UPI0030F64D23
MLKLENVSKKYHNKSVLENIDLEIQPGEIVSLLGQSGSGKTTLLNIILGLTKMDSGKIYYENEDLTNVKMKDRGFNIVFQDYALFPHLNAYENIVYGLKNNLWTQRMNYTNILISLSSVHIWTRKSVNYLAGKNKESRLRER